MTLLSSVASEVPAHSTVLLAFLFALASCLSLLILTSLFCLKSLALYLYTFVIYPAFGNYFLAEHLNALSRSILLRESFMIFWV